MSARRSLPALVRGAIIERYGRTCQYCGATSPSLYVGPRGLPWHIDHIVPVVRGGGDEESNLTLACASCNANKQGADTPDGAYQTASLAAYAYAVYMLDCYATEKDARVPLASCAFWIGCPQADIIGMCRAGTLSGELNGSAWYLPLASGYQLVTLLSGLEAQELRAMQVPA